MASPVVKLGSRLAVFGRTGSGKTYLTRWMVLRSPGRWVILDTKHDPEYTAWRPKNGLLTMAALNRAWQDDRIVVVRPSPQQNNWRTLDRYLMDLHETFEGFGTVIDEAYQVCPSASVVGDGVTGLITRGRVREQAVIVGSQRPARVPLFVFSEASAYVVMSLNRQRDRNTAWELTGQDAVLRKIAPRSWLYYSVDADRIVSYSPVSIEN